MADAASKSDFEYPPLSPFATGLAGRCPRCGKGAIFDGLLELKPRCESCGLDLTVADTGDGPSFFVSFIGGFLVLGAGVTLQVMYDPPIWAYLIVLAVGCLVCVAMLRPVKGLLTALQFVNKAEQGVLEP